MRASEYVRPILANLPPDHPPILVVVSDTEEEFDWTRPHDRSATSVEAIREIHRAQDIFDRFEIRPTYAVDYPIASQPLSTTILGEIHRSGRAEIGAHLHPWVSPPHEEMVDAFNSYPGNLPPTLEARKLGVLRDMIQTAFGLAPTAYKAGRYGIGPNTAGILVALGFEVDLSLAPPFNYESDGGPDFTDTDPGAGWIDEVGGLLSLPATGGFTGFLHRYGAKLHRAGSHPLASRLHMIGLLSRLGALNHYRLSPEQYRFAELRSLTRALLAAGTRVLSFTFHSPTLKPGCTPYVRDAADLKRFLGDFQSYFTFFFQELGGISATPLEVKRILSPVTLVPGDPGGAREPVGRAGEQVDRFVARQSGWEDSDNQDENPGVAA